MQVYTKSPGLDELLIIEADNESEGRDLERFAQIGTHFAGELRKDCGNEYPYIVLEKIEEQPKHYTGAGIED